MSGTPVVIKVDTRPHAIMRDRRRKMARYREPVGDVHIAWNMLHANFANMLAAILKGAVSDGKAGSDCGRALWHISPSDRVQRDILAAVASNLLRPTSREARAIHWLLEMTAKLSEGRNDYTHTPLRSELRVIHIAPKIEVRNVVGPDWVTGPPKRVARLNEVPDLAKHARRLANNLYLLARYAEVVLAHVVPREGFAPLWSWPKRPRLQLGAPKGRPKRPRRATRRPAPQPQPSPSPR